MLLQKNISLNIYFIKKTKYKGRTQKLTPKSKIKIKKIANFVKKCTIAIDN